MVETYLFLKARIFIVATAWNLFSVGVDQGLLKKRRIRISDRLNQPDVSIHPKGGGSHVPRALSLCKGKKRINVMVLEKESWDASFRDVKASPGGVSKSHF